RTARGISILAGVDARRIGLEPEIGGSEAYEQWRVGDVPKAAAGQRSGAAVVKDIRRKIGAAGCGIVIEDAVVEDAGIRATTGGRGVGGHSAVVQGAG